MSEKKTAIVTKEAPGAIGPYSQGIEVNGFVYTSGQLPLHPETGEMGADITAQTTQSLENVKAVLAASGVTMSDVIKTTVFLADMSYFGAMNEVYGKFFEGTFPARSCFAVKELPKAALVEIEVVAVK